MEYVPGGELFEYVKNQEGMAENDAKEMFREILQGVKHCHDNGIAHRDLKLENILLDKDNKPKVRPLSGLRRFIVPHPPNACSPYLYKPLFTLHPGINDLSKPSTDL